MTYITTGNRPVPDNFDDYFASLGKNMRQNYNKVLNRAAKANETLSVECISDPQDIQDAVIKYGEIESKSWKADQGTAVTPDNAQGVFYRDMLTNLAQNNQACCWYYKINDQVVAVDMCVMQNHTLIILKTTFDEAFSKHSPALQLKVDMLRHYSEHNDINNIEFYGRVMQWHTRLNSETRELVHISWFRNQLIRKIFQALKKLKNR